MILRCSFYRQAILRYLSLSIFTVLFITENIDAQENHFPSGVWLGYTLRKPVAKKFSWNSDLQLRFVTNKTFYDYTLIRTGLQYEMNEHFSTAAGVLYGLDNYEGKTLPAWKNEKRLWQECRYFLGKLTALQVMLQFRLEERWFIIESEGNGQTALFASRFRHRIDLRKSIKTNWRVNASDEIMFQNANHQSSFNQNRVWCGISRLLSHRNELSAQLMLTSWKAPDVTVLRINFLHQL